VGARSERAPRVDDDRRRAGVRLLPGWADPERADADRPVEGPPAHVPVGLDVAAARAAEDLPEPLLARGGGVRGELHAVLALDLLEPLREELEHRGARLLGTLRPHLHGDAAQAGQRKWLRSFSKKPSSGR
jgi:hypothetical protein